MGRLKPPSPAPCLKWVVDTKSNELNLELKDHCNGIVFSPKHLPFSKVIFRMFQEGIIVPARNSNILSFKSGCGSGLLSPLPPHIVKNFPLSPPNNKTPLPSGDSAIEVRDRA